MKKFFIKTMSLGLIVGLYSVVALAQSTTSSMNVANQSVSETKVESSEGFKMPVSLSYTGFFFGPQVSKTVAGHGTAEHKPTDSFSDLNDISSQEPLEMIHRFTIGKSFGKNRISLNPELNTVLTEPSRQGGRGTTWRDSFIRYDRAGLIDTSIGHNAFALDFQARLFVPTSKATRETNQLGSLRTYLNPSLKFGNSIFSLTAENWIRAYLLTDKQYNAAGGALKSLQIYSGPQLNAQIASNLNVYVLYEATAVLNTKGTWSNDPTLGNATTDIQPGMDITFNKNLTLSPYLNWYPALPLESTTLNLIISASL